MRYYAKYNESGRLLAIGTGLGGTEISESEYTELLNIIRVKSDYVNRLYSGQISIADVPAQWQEEIQRRVNERREREAEAEEEAEASEEDYRAALAELGVEI